MPTCTLTVGLPASGKSTWAREQADVNTIVCTKDDLRAMLHQGQPWSKQQEHVTTRVQQEIANVARELGKDIIIADTNLNRYVQQQWFDWCVKSDYTFKIKSFTDVPLQTCIDRDQQRTGTAHVGKSVIMDMYDRWLG